MVKNVLNTKDKLFYDGFTEVIPTKVCVDKPVRDYTVYLFRAPYCIRGWLSYLRPSNGDDATFVVKVKAENGSKAKNIAITAANKNFAHEDVVIVSMNFHDKLWGINNFDELKEKWSYVR